MHAFGNPKMITYLREKLSVTWVGIITFRIISSIELMIMKLYKDRRVINLIKEIKKEDNHFLLKPSEIFLVYSLALAQRKLDGDYSEVGVYRGSSAKMICEAKGDKPLYLFDTFEGLPEVEEIDVLFSKNLFSVNLDCVGRRLAKYKNVYIAKGVFPETASIVMNKRFAFVHLDVDIYKSTRDCLGFFYDRMVKGGIILSHDYSQAKGVKKAFDEFFENKIEEIIELPMTQCMVIKL